MNTKRSVQCVKEVALLCIAFAIACNAGTTPQLGYHKQADSSTQLSTDQSEYALLAPITITYSGMPGTGTPLITIAHEGSPDTTDEQYYLPGGQTSGTIVAHNIPPGTFVVRAYYDSSYTLQAESAPFIVDPATWTASVSTDLSVYPHMAPITVTYSGMSGAASDAIFIAKAGTPEGSYEQFQFLYGSINGTVVFYQLPPGDYVARAYYDDNYSLDQVAESAPFTIQPVAWSSSLSTDATMFSAGMSVPVHYGGMSGSHVDMITIAQQGSDDLSYVQYQFTGGALSGTLNFDGLPVGTYVARAYYDDDSVNYYNSGTKKAESAPFTVANAQTVALSTNQSSYAPDAQVVVTYSGMLGSSSDWIAIAEAGSDDASYVLHQYTGSSVNGEISFSGLPTGSYVARAYFSNSFTKEAESATFSVDALSGPPDGPDRSQPLTAPLVSTVVGTEMNGSTNALGFPITDDFAPEPAISVAPDGAATAHIPLWVAPGRNGMQPELALDYNSRGGRSVVGHGWQLSGIPTITRCPKTAADSGSVSAAIKFDSSDQFCLDGEPLVVDPSDNSFRTLHDSFRKIKITATNNSGVPAQFQAYQRDGRTLTFDVLNPNRVEVTATAGQNGDNAINPHVAGTVGYVWILSSVEDQSHNRMTVSWFTELSSFDEVNDYYPQQIAYASNLPAALGTTKTILFGYDEEHGAQSWGPSPVTWHSGVGLSHNHLLTSITVQGPNANESDTITLKKYYLTYESLATTEPSHTYGQPNLHALHECDGVSVCKPALIFEYDGDLSKWPANEWTDIDANTTNVLKFTQPPPGQWPATIYTPDLDGDGRSDLLYLPNATMPASPSDYVVQLSNGTMAAPALSQQLSTNFISTLANNPVVALSGTNNRLFPFDYDGNGVSDIFAVFDDVSSNNPCCAEIAAPTVAGSSSFGFISSTAANLGSLSAGEVADLNGDGLPDLIETMTVPVYNNSSLAWDIRLNTGGALQAPSIQFTGPNDHLLVDVDGDGAFEVLTTQSDLDTAHYSAIFGDGRRETTTLDNDTTYVFADLNGDGLADAISFGYLGANDAVNVRFNTGNGFFSAVTFYVGFGVLNATKRVLDYNKDGRQDLLVRPNSTLGPNSGPLMGCPGGSQCIFVLWYDGSSLQVAPILPGLHGITLAGTNNNDESNMTEIADINGDGLDDIVMLNGGELHVYVRGQAPTIGKMLHGIRRSGVLHNGIYSPGVQFDIDYKPISDPSVYQSDPATPSLYPQTRVDSKVWVVSSIERHVENDNEVLNTTQYNYVGGRGDMRGRGFLGFEQVAETRVESSTTTTTTYDLSPQTGTPSFYPYVGFPKETDIAVTGSSFAYSRSIAQTPVVVQTTTGAAGTNAFYVYSQATNDSAQIEENGVPSVLHNVGTTRSLDPFGNPLSETIVHEDGSSDQVDHHYTYQYNFPWTGIQTDRIIETSITPLAGGLARVTDLSYDTQWRLTSRVDLSVGNDRGEQTLITTIVPTAEGLVGSVSSAETAARGGATRQMNITYDAAEHAFPSVHTDGLGHITRRAWHPGFGVVAIDEDLNGQQAIYQFDGLMRRMSQSLSTGEQTTWSYSTYEGDPYAPYNAGDTVVRILEVHNGNGEVDVSESNWRQKPTLTRQWNRLDGQAVFTSAVYDNLDRLVTYTPPMFENGTPTPTTFTFDNLSRVQDVSLSDGSTRHNQFFGTTTVSTDGRGNRRNSLVDGRGRLTRTIESSDGSDSLTTQYSYGPFNTLYRVTDTNGNVFQTDVNRLGQPYHQTSGDIGSRVFTVNAFGEIEIAITPEFEKKYLYDALGRLEAEQNLNLGTTTSFRWDTAPYGIGKIASATSPDNVTTTFTYDNHGRLAGKTWSMQMPMGFQQYSVGMTYDSFGRLDVLTYPAIPGQQLSVQYHYGAGGQLASVIDPSSGHAYWTLQDSSASGAFTTESFLDGTTVTRTESATQPTTLGNIHVATGGGATLYDVSYLLDGNQNVRSRTDNVNNQSETFGYDHLNRLTSWTWNDGGLTQQESYQYDGLGNLRARKVLQGTGSDRFFDTDPSGHAGPHQITGGSAFYQYDGNGRQISDATRTIAYTDFDLPALITTSSSKQVAFSYDADKQRVLKYWLNGDFAVELGDLFEEYTVNGVAVNVLSIFANGKHVAAVVDFAGSSQVLNVIGDHLGSTQLVTKNCSDPTGLSCFQGSGGIVDKLKYDPFGNRIAFDLPLQASGLPASGIRVGFAEQTQDDEPSLNMVDMRGRVYDPAQARFLSPDPIVARPESGQSFNPYSYVWNNPLRYRDPSGFEPYPDGFEPCGSSVANGCSFPIVDIYRTPDPSGPFDRTDQAANVSTGTLAAPQSAGGVNNHGARNGANGPPAAIQPSKAIQAGTWHRLTSSELGDIAVQHARRQQEGDAWLINELLDVARIPRGPGRQELLLVVSIVLPVAGPEATAARAAEIHGALDPIAQEMRTTAVLETSAGRIVASGARDLTPAQRALLGPGEVAAKLPGAHAEVTALDEAAKLGVAPESLAVTRPICPECAAFIEDTGGVLTGPTTAEWPGVPWR